MTRTVVAGAGRPAGNRGAPRWASPPPATRRLARWARRHALTGRLLAEIQVWRLSRGSAPANLVVCQELALPGSLAIDVGASVGTYTLGLAKAVGRRGRVLALEASPTVYEELVHSTVMARVLALNLAASSDTGWAQLYVPVGHGGQEHARLATLEHSMGRLARRVPVRRVRLDDLVGTDRTVSLIKVDAKGHEYDVLSGAVGTVDDHRPCLLIEIEQRYLVHRSVAEVVTALCTRDYLCHALAGRTLMPWDEFDLERDQLRWVRPGAWQGLSVILDPRRYVNSFIFVPAERANQSLTRLRRRLGIRGTPARLRRPYHAQPSPHPQLAGGPTTLRRRSTQP